MSPRRHYRQSLHTVARRIYPLLLLAVAGCPSVPLDRPKSPSTAIADTSSTYFAQVSAAWRAADPDANSFHPLIYGMDALGARLALMDKAERSIDAQYFIMKPDLAGTIFASKLYAAAEKGVRVRVLLDDVFTTVDDHAFVPLDQHPNIELRIFNPISRKGLFALNYAGNFRLANRRMHNKSLVVDNPEKLVQSVSLGEKIVANRIVEAIQNAQEEIIVFTPYFIPGPKGIALIREVREKGVRVVLVTNSLATNNHIAVHSAYSSYRKRILQAGIELWEARRNSSEIVGEDGRKEMESLTLHTKGIIVDRHYTFVGSLNLDPRSIDINTEMGVMIDSKKLAESLAEITLRRIPDFAYQLQLDERNRISWHANIDGREVVEPKEPLASGWRRFQAWVLKIAPEKQL